MIASLAASPFRRFVLVRHGEAVNAAGRCIGHTDLPLSEVGKAGIQRSAQALRTRFAVECWAETGQIVSSDLSRAKSSAAIIATELGMHASHDARLREMNFGEWDGLAWSAIETNDGARCRAWMERWTAARPPAGETVRDVVDRAAAWLDSTLSMPPQFDTIVVVTHAGWIRAALCYLTGAPIEQMFDFPSDYARATVVEVREGVPNVLLLNDSLS